MTPFQPWLVTLSLEKRSTELELDEGGRGGSVRCRDDLSVRLGADEVFCIVVEAIDRDAYREIQESYTGKNR